MGLLFEEVRSGSVERFFYAAAIILASISSVIFRRPIARYTVRMQNVTWGFRFGERSQRLTELWILVVAALAIAVAVLILVAPSPSP